ncbi:MAG: CDC27 family protein [Sulfurimonas sp.]|nr:CDC27 family protein [Sulfurimonas sp.]MDD3059821.1 CDC27 family protein [Sulfurimonas sp.]MDD5202295.1 CDC27 family protein [Sulfurimonas sp.]
MLNISQLEQKWLRYKIKSYLPLIVILISSLLIIILLNILINLNYFKVETQEENTVHKPEEMKEKIIIKEKNINEIPPQVVSVKTTTLQENAAITITQPLLDVEKKEQERKVTLTPSMNFIKNMQHNNLEYDNEPVQASDTKRIQIMQPQTPPTPIKMEEIVMTETIELEEKPSQTIEEAAPKEEKSKTSVVNIKRQDTYSDIKEIIQRFKKNNNPTLSLFIAKKYYNLGEYREAYNYSLITNELNKDIEASWIIFAQSLVKLGDKEKAIKVLKEYAKQSNSSRANLLLDEILSGKFK